MLHAASGLRVSSKVGQELWSQPVMVVASNEWLNNYEDEQKSASANNTTANTTNASNTTTTTTTATSSTQNTAPNTASTVATSTTTTTPTFIQTIPSATTVADNANNSNEQPLQTQQLQQTPQNPMINSDLKIKEEVVDVDVDDNDKDETVAVIDTGTASDIDDTTSLKSEFENNNFEQPPTPPISTTPINISKSNSSSTTSLQTLTHPITPEDLSNALQSALNATGNNAVLGGGVSGANLQKRFMTGLSGFGGTPASAALQETATNLAKKLSSSLCIMESQVHLNNVMTADHQLDNNGQAKILLHCEPNSHPFQMRTILLTPNIECKVGRLIAKSKASESNAIFDCKVLSRNHAVLWYSNDGKFWVKDTKSSNGTFINESKLGSDAAELHFGDVVKFGVDVMENSRKEVHGCIIAGVKLYLPDGREKISIDAGNGSGSGAQLSPYSGEGRISFDELHRLNLYMQEASQREKVLKSKLFNIQNILDATRKNSALCWQSMIAEDQLLHRIHSLEKKLQLMEKNVPESVLRNEVIKLHEDKNSYQHSAKEALRKVYQERCDALKMLSKMESAFTTSDNECKILRDQIMNTKQSLQDVNARLLCLESEYNEYKEETVRQQEEAKAAAELQATELTEKLRMREQECEDLRRKISELLLKQAELIDEEQLQKQAIEKLDAAIADMDLGDDDEDDDDDDEDEVGNEENDNDEQHAAAKALEHLIANELDKNVLDSMNTDEINGGGQQRLELDATSNSSSEKDKTSPTAAKTKSADSPNENSSSNKQKVAKKSTILKWLENSDLNKKDGSLEIFEAICNESDSSDEQETVGAGTKTNINAATAAVGSNKAATTTNNVDNKTNDFVKFNSKLRSVQQTLTQLEAEIANDAKQQTNDGSSAASKLDAEDSDEDEDENLAVTAAANDADVLLVNEMNKRNGGGGGAEKTPTKVLSKNNKSYILLKNSVNMLREAYNEICDNMQQEQLNGNNNASQQKQQTPPPAISMKTQFHKKLESQNTLKPAAAALSSDSEEDDDEAEEDSASIATSRISLTSLQTIKETGEEQLSTLPHDAAAHIKAQYQQQIDGLQQQLEQIECDAQNTLEIMQIECDGYKDKIATQNKLVDTLQEEKQALQQVINENKSNALKTAEAAVEQAAAVQVALKTLEQEKSKTAELVISELANVVASNSNVNDTSSTSSNASNAFNSNSNAVSTTSSSSSFEQQTRDDLADINSAAVQREEELIMYKEQLEQTQCANLKLRNEIADMKLKADVETQTLLMQRVMPYGAIVIAVLVYFIFKYF